MLVHLSRKQGMIQDSVFVKRKLEHKGTKKCQT